MLFWRLGKTFSLTLPELTILVTIKDVEIGTFFFSWTAAVIWREMGDRSWLQRKVITGHYYLSLSLWVYVVQDHRVQWTCDAHMLSKLRRRWSTLVAFGCSGSVLQSFSSLPHTAPPPLPSLAFLSLTDISIRGLLHTPQPTANSLLLFTRGAASEKLWGLVWCQLAREICHNVD